MKKNQTSRELQRAEFVDNLYRKLRRQTQAALDVSHKWTKLASSYIQDGMDTEEAVELLMIDGLTADAARGYIHIAQNSDADSDCDEYTFQFEDTYGKIWNSFDLGKVVTASSDQEAWKKAESIIFSEINDCEPEKIISVTKI